MKVKDLIAKLQEFDSEMNVYFLECESSKPRKSCIDYYWVIEGVKTESLVPSDRCDLSTDGEDGELCVVIT